MNLLLKDHLSVLLSSCQVILQCYHCPVFSPFLYLSFSSCAVWIHFLASPPGGDGAWLAVLLLATAWLSDPAVTATITFRLQRMVLGWSLYRYVCVTTAKTDSCQVSVDKNHRVTRHWWFLCPLQLVFWLTGKTQWLTAWPWLIFSPSLHQVVLWKQTPLQTKHFFALFHLCQWIFVKLKVWSAKTYSTAKLGKKATREAFHSERSFIKTCFPGFSGFLLSHQHYRHSEETFFMAMCKNSVWKENSYILRLNTDSSYCSWLALDHTYWHSIKFSFFLLLLLFQIHKTSTELGSLHCSSALTRKIPY